MPPSDTSETTYHAYVDLAILGIFCPHTQSTLTWQIQIFTCIQEYNKVTDFHWKIPLIIYYIFALYNVYSKIVINMPPFSDDINGLLGIEYGIMCH